MIVESLVNKKGSGKKIYKSSVLIDGGRVSSKKIRRQFLLSSFFFIYKSKWGIKQQTPVKSPVI